MEFGVHTGLLFVRLCDEDNYTCDPAWSASARGVIGQMYNTLDWISMNINQIFHEHLRRNIFFVLSCIFHNSNHAFQSQLLEFGATKSRKGDCVAVTWRFSLPGSRLAPASSFLPPSFRKAHLLETYETQNYQSPSPTHLDIAFVFTWIRLYFVQHMKQRMCLPSCIPHPPELSYSELIWTSFLSSSNQQTRITPWFIHRCIISISQLVNVVILQSESVQS